MWLIGLALANEPPPTPRPTTERLVVTRAVLANELEVVVAHHPSWRTVSIATVIDGGLVAESRAGLSRALADSWMASSPVEDLDVRALYERLGAQSTVRVEPEATVFWVHGPASSTEMLLALERQRFTNPLVRVRKAALPSRPTMSTGFTARYLEMAYASLYPDPHPYHAIWRPPTSLDLPLDAAAELAAATWTPARTTLVVAGPDAPADVLCALEPEVCGDPTGNRVALESRITLPPSDGRVEYALADLPDPAHPDVGPVAAGIIEPTVLLSWSLPGLDSGTQQVGRFAVERIEEGLRDGALGDRLTRCHLFEGRANSTAVCVLRAGAGADLRKLRRQVRNGWSTRRLGEATGAWRSRVLGRLLGASGEASQVPRMAEYLHRTDELAIHGGDLEGLAFDDRDVALYLEQVFSDERLSVVRLVP